MTAAIGVSILVLFTLAVVLIRFGGQIGKPHIDRSRALHQGFRPRSRAEILHELKQGCLEFERAEAEAKRDSMRAARRASDLGEARRRMELAMEGVGHA